MKYYYLHLQGIRNIITTIFFYKFTIQFFKYITQGINYCTFGLDNYKNTKINQIILGGQIVCAKLRMVLSMVHENSIEDDCIRK